MSSVVFLKIKLKSLAAESKIIRQQELKMRGGSELRDQLANHRRKDVRAEARATHLAYGYLRGRAYRRLEAVGSSAPPLANAERMVKKYGGVDAVAGFQAWAKVEPVRLEEVA